MRFLLLNSDYPEFLTWLYEAHPGLGNRPCEEQLSVRSASLFGTADFYSRQLRELGHEAWDIHVNNEPLQTAWAREHGVRWTSGKAWHFRLRGGFLPWVSRGPSAKWMYEILAAQIQHLRPDIILTHVIDPAMTSFLAGMKSRTCLLVGQVASPLPRGVTWRAYDIMISSLPNFVEYFSKLGVRSQLLRFGFEPLVLSRVQSRPRTIALSFVGSLFPYHKSRIQLLEYLCGKTEIRIWGNGVERLPRHSPIRARHEAVCWGVEMYQVMLSSRITLNHHIGIAEQFANNMRLFEATGSGALLLTDWKANLHEMFEPGKEVAVYRTAEECANLISFYLKNEKNRENIARAGQERTLREHTYGQRMRELADLLEDHRRKVSR
jgi:hypothetical protein